MQDELKLVNHEAAEEQLLEVQKTISFSLTDFPVEVLVTKMPSQGAEGADFIVPAYQRNFTWEKSRQCKFIESVLMGLPIPFLFGYVDPEQEDRTVIVDGVQRLSTLRAFIYEGLKLTGLEKLYELNGFTFNDLSQLQKRRLKRRIIRMVILDQADPETQFELFERINTGSKAPSPAEIRRGAYTGPFRDLVVEFAKDKRFEELTPMGKKKVDQREREELVVRLFCYSDFYQNFKHDVSRFINDYMKKKNRELIDSPELIDSMRREFSRFCDIALMSLPEGNFSAGSTQTPRNRFEALAVGMMLAIRNGVTELKRMDWVTSDGEFAEIVRSGGSNSSVKLQQRVEYVRDKICEEN